MKTVLALIVALVAYLGISVSFIWAFIEFILYLVKDKDFDWRSIWSIILCCFISLVLTVYLAFMKQSSKKNEPNEFGRKSKFQQRLEVMKEQRERNK